MTYLAAIEITQGALAFAPSPERLGLVERFASRRIRVWLGADTGWQRFDEHVLVVGSANKRVPQSLDAGDSDESAETRCRRFAEAHWGDHIAFCSVSDADDAVCVYRAVPGGQPAFRVLKDGVLWLTSDIKLLLAAGIVSPGIDWSFVAHHLAFPHLRGALTGISGVEEQFPGECVRVDQYGTHHEMLWSPWRFTEAANRFETIEAAESAVFEAVTGAVAALVRPFRAPLLELSGGLDSSVIAAAMAVAGVGQSAVNLVTPGTEGDERRYARLVASRTGLTLSEARMDAVLDLTRAGPGRLPRPGIPAMLRGADDHFIAFARAGGIDAFVSGTGGDSVFCSLGSAAPAADVLRTSGWGRTLGRTVSDVAAIHDSNLWSVGRMAMRQARRRRALSTWPGTVRFLQADALPATPLPHPWLIEPDNVLPGARSHVRSIVAALAHLDGYGRHRVAPSLFPLLSQPVIEACLRTPSWFWVEGGRDRAVARRAFRSLLPDEVLDRRGKGAMDAYCARTFAENRKRLRPFLLDGHLARAGLLDRVAIDACLMEEGPVRSKDFYRMLPIADAEVWLRGWLG